MISSECIAIKDIHQTVGTDSLRQLTFAKRAFHQDWLAKTSKVGMFNVLHAVGPKVLRPRELRPFFGDVCNVADDALANFIDGRNLDISDKLTMLAMENVAVFLLGVRFGLTGGASPDPKARELADAVTGRFSAESKLLFSIPFYEYVKTPTVKVLHRSLDKEMELTAYFMNETSQMRTPLTSKCIVHRLAEEGKISENEMFQVVGGMCSVLLL